MKVWHKIYLAVLAICVLFVNIGIYAVFELVYKKNIETEQMRCEVDYNVICDSIQNNMRAMYRQERLSDEAAADLIGLYEKNYRKQEMEFKLWRDEKQLYPENGGKIPLNAGKNKVCIVVGGSRKQKEIEVISEIGEFDGRYHLYVGYPLNELNATWDGLFSIYLYISFAISLVLAFLLNIMLRFLLRPISELVESVSNIGKGEYSSRINVKGNDEFSVLGENINLMAEDIEKNVNRLKEDNEKKEQLVDNLAHEMKSPLTSIYGFAEYIMNGKIEPEERAECCSFIMEESMRMKDMCYTLLDLSEIRHRKVDFENFNVNAFVEKMKQVIEMRQSDIIKSGNVTVEWENKLFDRKEIYGNERLMEMLILNLVSNAIFACERKHCMLNNKENGIGNKEADGYIREVSGEIDKEELKVKVSISHLDAWEYDFNGRSMTASVNNTGFLLCVHDNGIGIPKEKISHVTEPFYRVDKGRSRENGGNGLGLALCRQIVLLHGGEFEIKSEEGIGTTILSTFTF